MNIQAIKQAQAERLNMIAAAKAAGDMETYKRAVNSWVDNEGVINFDNEVKEMTPAETIEAKRQEIECNAIADDFYYSNGKAEADAKELAELERDILKSALDDVFYKWEENTYQPQYPRIYSVGCEKAVAFADYIGTMPDWELNYLLLEQPQFADVDDIPKETLKLARQLVAEGCDKILAEEFMGA